MHATIQAFWLPKAGNSESEYEDAFWPRRATDQTSAPIRLAIGDGATEASFSALWARLLVREYGLGHLSPGSLMGRLPALQSRWRRSLGKKPLPWYAAEKLRQGAFSSLLGLTLEADTRLHGSRGCWRAMAIGDSCLFQVRGEELIARFPLDRTDLFDNRPVLVSSLPTGNVDIDHALGVTGGWWGARRRVLHDDRCAGLLVPQTMGTSQQSPLRFERRKNPGQFRDARRPAAGRLD